MSGEGGYRETRGPGHEPATRSSELALRQLRRRYETLREDYEDVLERLNELEQRMSRPQAEPAVGSKLPSSPLGDQVQRVLSRPWFDLRDEYARAAQEMLGLTGAMDDLANRAFKGQRRARQQEVAHDETTMQQTSNGAVEDEAETEALHERSRQRNSTIQVQVQSPSLGALLDFQEQLSRLQDVARVSMSQVNEERALLIVELEPERVESNN